MYVYIYVYACDNHQRRGCEFEGKWGIVYGEDLERGKEREKCCNIIVLLNWVVEENSLN